MTVETVLRVMVLVCAGYLLLVYAAYAALIVVGLFENSVRRLESASQDYGTVASSRFTIPVTVILAAFNEESGVTASIRSLLAQDYPEFEVIVVNDGSTDGTLERLREDFSLEPAERFPRLLIETGRVRGYYESAAHPGLLVIDKENGGKADALNAGINAARFRYVCGVDADAIFFPDALLRGMRLVLSDPGRILGVTCHLAIAESPGRTASAPAGHRPVERRPLLAYQHLDYLRAFFNNRIAWSRLDFMLCAVGAFQIWRRDVLEELGGFARGFTCEDIELTFRIHETYLRAGRDYRILCLPDTVGVTEGPDTVRKLVAQRERWQRVILETVWSYRRMLGRPRYRSVGLLGVPYYVLSEVLAPVFEVARARHARDGSPPRAVRLARVRARDPDDRARERRDDRRRGARRRPPVAHLPLAGDRVAARARPARPLPLPADHRLGAPQGDVALPPTRQGLAQVRAQRPGGHRAVATVRRDAAAQSGRSAFSALRFAAT